jgi:hypothetical protein
VGNELCGVKWRNWKMMFKELENATSEVKSYGVPRFYDLYVDPKEEHPNDPRSKSILRVKKLSFTLSWARMTAALPKPE